MGGHSPETAVHLKPKRLFTFLRNGPSISPVVHTWAFAGTPEQFWAFQSDLGGAWSRPGWDALSTDEQAAAEAEVFSLLEAYQVGQRLDIPRRAESRDGYPIGRPPLSVRRKVDNIAVWAGFRSCS